VYHVVDVLRVKVPEADFREQVKRLSEQYDTLTVSSYVAATEQANIDLLQRDGVPAVGRRALADKKTRALPTAAAWNLGRIKVRANQPWTREFVREVVGFTGSDRRDDQVDALDSVFDSMHVSEPIDWRYIQEVQDAAPRTFDLMQGLH
jgi:predicted phage terminase large subunit-like protein